MLGEVLNRRPLIFNVGAVLVMTDGFSTCSAASYFLDDRSVTEVNFNSARTLIFLLKDVLSQRNSGNLPHHDFALRISNCLIIIYSRAGLLL